MEKQELEQKLDELSGMAKTLIDDSRKFLKRHKWIKGDEEDGQGGYCMFGAIHQTQKDLSTQLDKGELNAIVAATECVFADTEEMEIPEFNDDHATSKQQILRKFGMLKRKHRAIAKEAAEILDYKLDDVNEESTDEEDEA